MGDAEVDQAGLLAAGDHLHLVVDDRFGAADELGTVARFAQGVGADHAHRAFGQVVDQLGEAPQAVQAALHGGFVEQPLLGDAGGQLHLFAEPFEDPQLAVAGAGQHHVETVGAQVQGGDQGKGIGGSRAHGRVSERNRVIVT